MKLDKEDIATAKCVAKTLQQSKNDELVVVGNLLAYLLAEREEQPKETEQEPVPDLYVKDINGNFHSYKEKGHTVSSQCVPPSHVGVGEDDFTPQQSTIVRKPLTDQQRNSIIQMTHSKGQVIDMVEAAHGITGEMK